ncbi:MAG: hypothetical protein ACR2JU_01680 [Nocardioidaceae bacterium]
MSLDAWCQRGLELRVRGEVEPGPLDFVAGDVAHPDAEHLCFTCTVWGTEPSPKRKVDFSIENAERRRHRVLRRDFTHDVNDVVAGAVVSALTGLPIPIHVERERHAPCFDTCPAEVEGVLKRLSEAVTRRGARQINPLVLVEVDAEHVVILVRAANRDNGYSWWAAAQLATVSLA